MAKGEGWQRGKALRGETPRSAHAEWSPSADRTSPVDLVTAQNANRLQWLVPIRHTRMSASAFTFYRGAAAVMAADLAATPTTGVHPQICGDAHLSNFGFYGSPERDLVFDVNDFDETLPGPWEWDVKRLATSFTIAARNNGLGHRHQSDLPVTAAQAYRRAMRRLAERGYLDVWYARVTSEDIWDVFGKEATKSDLKRYRKTVEKARGKDSRHAAGKLVEQHGSRYQIISDPPEIVPLRDLASVEDPDALRAGLEEAFADYLESVPDHIGQLLRRFTFVDFAVKAVGVGSVGTRCYIVLLEGKGDEPFFLQVKEATRSVLEEHLPSSRYATAGRRVVEGQHLMQSVSDIFLGWTDAESSGHQYYWRQLKDMKGSADVEEMDADGLARYAKLCGWTLARSHARSTDPDVIAGYLGKSDTFDVAIGEFATRYADQNESDYAEFLAAIESGAVPVETP